MDGQITAIYSLCEDVLKTLHYAEDPQCRMSDAEVMTTAIVTALYFGGDLERARGLLAAAHLHPSDALQEPLQSAAACPRRVVDLLVPGVGGGLQTAQCQFGVSD